MKYLVNRETKEHTPLSGDGGRYSDLYFDVVEADEEGWIPWSEGECPLPYDCKVAIIIDKRIYDQDRAGDWDWRDDLLNAYRPILSETAGKEEPRRHGRTIAYIPETQESVFDRLKSAIAASESIPGIIAEIDAMLPEGYCVVQSVQPPTLDLQPAEDMSDWRNWREGDFVTAIVDSPCGGYVVGRQYKITKSYEGIIDTAIDSRGQTGNGWGAYNFRFHSRPAKE